MNGEPPHGHHRRGLERADQEAFTRPIPKSAGAQMRYLVKQLKGTRAVAELLGVSQRTVERYVKDQIRRLRADLAQRLVDAVRARWQPQVRKRRQQQAAATGGITVETRARFGYTAPIGTTDDGRFRRLTVHLPRPTPAACSTPATVEPATSRCAESSPRDSKMCISRMAAPAQWTCQT
jgi:hypothetical protein